MSTPTPKAQDNRAAAIQWIDAFNTRDDPREAGLRMPDYIAHTPESIGTAPLDSDAWVEFLGVFLEGFPDLHLELQITAADEHMVAQRILSPPRTPAISGAFHRPTTRSASAVSRSTAWSTGRSPSTGSSWTRSRSSSRSACSSCPARG